MKCQQNINVYLSKINGNNNVTFVGKAFDKTVANIFQQKDPSIQIYHGYIYELFFAPFGVGSAVF